MFAKLWLIAFSFIVALMLAANRANVSSHEQQVSHAQRSNTISCSPDWNVITAWIDENEIPVIPGAGKHKWKISTRSDSAQFYFNQGINMYYSFHIIESLASFKKAARFDPSSAMLHWAQALAYGPNINDVGYAASYEAYLAAGKAVDYCKACSEKERLLVEAQQSRYTGDSTEDRKALNKLYAQKMKEVYLRFPNDADVATLYADALMLLHPWDLWNVNGSPKSWTPEIRELLEKVLVKNQDHPGANHYYIHVMEPSPFPEKALPSADRLGKLTPGLSHTVHMPSHIYLRTGKYNKGVAVNEAAVSSYKKAIALYAPAKGGDFLYLIHNLHMQTNHSMLGGRYAYSIETAEELVNSIPNEYLSLPGGMGNYIQYIHMTPLLVHVRFGKWEEILSFPKPAKPFVYSTLLYHFARGIAYSHQEKFTEAGHELDAMRELMKDSVLFEPFTPFSPAIDGARVAEQLLLGVIHERRNLYEGAIRHFKQADSIEVNMVYNEPRDWLLNPKHFLGYALLKADKFPDAEKIFMADLKQNSDNGWALLGLSQSLLGQNKKSESEKIHQRFKHAFSKADVKINSSIY